jgi:hypothetical protein
MVSLDQLWIPIVASAVLVFVASSIIHMVIKWHNSDYRGFSNEDAVRAAVRASNPAPGQYFIPYCADPKDMRKPEILQKFTDGPIGVMTLRPAGPPTMTKALVLWFVSSLVISAVAGYLASRTLPFGAGFLAVCRVVSIVAFFAYGWGAVHQAIWMGKPWGSAVKELIDAFIYGLITAATFGWLWPR